ncbi:MAG: FixH family protein [Moheibacter sp.]
MKKFRFHWGHGLMVALGCFMIFIVSLIAFSGNMGEMVEDDYYEKTIHYQNDIDAQERVNQLHHKPELIKQANGFLIRFQEPPQEGIVNFLRLNNSSQDVKKTLKLNVKNEQLIPEANLKDGEYEVSIRWKQGGKDYLFKKTVHWKDPSL